MTEYEYNPDAIEILEELEKVAGGPDITTLFSDKMPTELRDILSNLVNDYSDLWYIQARDKRGNEILVFRDIHP